MPLPQGDWAAAVGNRLIAEQHAYNREEQTTLADEQIPTLNEGQQAAFTGIFDAVESGSGQTFFLHGPGGTGKTHVYNTLCHYLCGQGKVVVCVASSGIASLLPQHFSACILHFRGFFSVSCYWFLPWSEHSHN